MKTLALDLGNSTLFVGVFRDAKLMRSFRLRWSDLKNAGIFADQVLPKIRGKVDRVALCSVVPKQTARLSGFVRKTLGMDPLVLTPSANHGLTLNYRRPAELGADRVATALGARKLYPRKNIIVVDCGTATTLTLLRRDGCLLGGTIMPGLRLWVEMLAKHTASLPEVTLTQPREVVGRDTTGALRSGILHGHTGAIKELISRCRAEVFGKSPVVVLGTGGQVTQINYQSLFTTVETGLILHGLQAFASGNTAHA